VGELCRRDPKWLPGLKEHAARLGDGDRSGKWRGTVHFEKELGSGAEVLGANGHKKGKRRSGLLGRTLLEVVKVKGEVESGGSSRGDQPRSRTQGESGFEGEKEIKVLLGGFWGGRGF